MDSKTKRLYRVSWYGECYIMATDGDDACEKAVIELRRDPEGAGIMCSDTEIDKLECPDSEWADVPPFRGDGKRTVGELIAGMRRGSAPSDDTGPGEMEPKIPEAPSPTPEDVK